MQHQKERAQNELRLKGFDWNKILKELRFLVGGTTTSLIHFNLFYSPLLFS